MINASQLLADLTRLLKRLEDDLRQRIADVAELKASLKGRVADWWIPDRIVRVEAMPLAATGKINKTQLRAAYGDA